MDLVPTSPPLPPPPIRDEGTTRRTIQMPTVQPRDCSSEEEWNFHSLASSRNLLQAPERRTMQAGVTQGLPVAIGIQRNRPLQMDLGPNSAIQKSAAEERIQPHRREVQLQATQAEPWRQRPIQMMAVNGHPPLRYHTIPQASQRVNEEPTQQKYR